MFSVPKNARLTKYVVNYLNCNPIKGVNATNKNIKLFATLSGMLRSYLALHPLCWP